MEQLVRDSRVFLDYYAIINCMQLQATTLVHILILICIQRDLIACLDANTL